MFILKTNNMEFYVVHTKARQESKAAANLVKQGFQVWLPYYSKELVKKKSLISLKEPFFPGYLFIRIDLENNNWSKINNSYGVKHLLKMNDKPVPLSNRVIRKLKLVVSGRFIKLGDSVKVLKGPMVNKIGKVEKLCGSERVRILFEAISGKLFTILNRVDICKI